MRDRALIEFKSDDGDSSTRKFLYVNGIIRRNYFFDFDRKNKQCVVSMVAQEINHADAISAAKRLLENQFFDVDGDAAVNLVRYS